MIWNEGGEKPVQVNGTWGIEELPVVDRYTFLRVDVAKTTWNANMAKVAKRGKRDQPS